MTTTRKTLGRAVSELLDAKASTPLERLAAAYVRSQTRHRFDPVHYLEDLGEVSVLARRIAQTDTAEAAEAAWLDTADRLHERAVAR